MPPSKEQSQISEQVRQEISRHRCAEEQIELSIDSLEEYRAALLTAAVTGQISELR